MSDKMNPEVKAKWLTALRSGEHTQTKEYLNKDGGLCCLGVLCEVAVEDGVVSRVHDTKDHDESAKVYGYSDGSPMEDRYLEYSTLPSSVRDWAGLPSVNPYVKIGDYEEYPLSDVNDDKGKTFAEIADLIEEQF